MGQDCFSFVWLPRNREVLGDVYDCQLLGSILFLANVWHYILKREFYWGLVSDSQTAVTFKTYDSKANELGVDLKGFQAVELRIDFDRGSHS